MVDDKDRAQKLLRDEGMIGERARCLRVIRRHARDMRAAPEGLEACKRAADALDEIASELEHGVSV